ncbi:MAG TPA: cytochrome c3 family protein [Anaerolineales bacterium]|nr:cytochrome c3 family protein [Anaerolineales bacterium]
MSKWIKAHKLQFGLGILVVGIFMVLAAMTFSTATSVSAAPLPQREPPTDEMCLFCHQNQGLSVDFGGQSLSLFIDGDKFSKSVHKSEGLACVDCHSNITSFPHPEVNASSPRDFRIEMYSTCQQCHAEQYQKVLDSVHQSELAAGNINAAVCTDCHNPHTQSRLTNKETGELLEYARLHIPETCAACHSTIYETYKESVHGSALTQEGNPFVPTCIDCHGVHDITDPRTNTFRNSTPYLCAECHTNQGLMNQFDISTNVLDTYVADFHGTTVKIFEESYPDQPTNKPVCTDCHGIHNILNVDDANAGIAHKNNLLVKCQQCHPDATTDSFTDSWMSHYEPSPETWPLVYYVNLFYKFFIPAVLGGMIVFILTDIYRRFIARGKGASHK